MRTNRVWTPREIPFQPAPPTLSKSRFADVLRMGDAHLQAAPLENLAGASQD
jgi:hypothetical protein